MFELYKGPARAWGLAAVGLCFAALVWPDVGAAQPQPATAVLMFDPTQVSAGEPLVAEKGDPLLIGSVRAERAVRLEASADTIAVNAVGMKLKRPLAVGQVLMAATSRPGVFCAPIVKGAVYAVAPCLSDADGDGAFEAAVTVTYIGNGATDLALTAKGEVFGVAFDPSPPPRVPVAYTAADYKDGAAASADLLWRSDYDRRFPERPVSVELWMEAKPSSGTHVYSASRMYVLEGGMGVMEFAGTVIRVLGIEPDGKLRYRVEEAAPAQRIAFAYQPPRETIYIYH